MSAQRATSSGARGAAAGLPDADALSAEDFPYDPTLRLESQHGLDRLRCIADRALAADFFAIYQATERNDKAAALAQREQARRDEAELDQLRVLADRALAGEFGSDETELTKRLLVDARGRLRTDLRTLREFKRALVQLRRER